MKKFAFVFFFYISFYVWCNSFYEIESQGYFKNPLFVNDGIICTDNYDSAIYLIQNHSAKKLLSAPGAGRFFSINKKKTKIGFKWIDSETGLQRPAIFDLTQHKITYLAEKLRRCSQVYFYNDSVYYILDKKLNILSENDLQVYHLPDFSNLMAISPDGNIIALRNEKEQIFLYHLLENQYSVITPSGESYLPISWSKDGKYLLIKDIGEGLYLYDSDKKAIIDLEIKGFAEWYDSPCLLISQKEWNKENIKTTLLLYDIASGTFEKIKKSDTFLILDFDIESNSLTFTSPTDKSIYRGKITNGELTSIEKMFQLNDNLETIKIMRTQRTTSKNLSIPYINQMYDTPQGYGHNYGACAAATATMAIMFYKILPHWDTTNASPYAHVTHWGNYIGGTIYTYRGVVYNQSVYYESGAGWCYNGIDNYHWYEGSPNSKMKNLLQNHGLNSSQHWTSSCTYSMISGQIANDYPYPLCVTMTTSGHLILAKGFYNDNQKLLYYHDPYGNKNTYPYLGYDGNDVVYDWPGENNGYASLVSVAWSVSALATHQPEPELEIDVLQLAYGASHEDYSVENPGFFLSTTGTLGMRYWRSEIGGNNEIYWWTGAIGGYTDDYFATWRPNIIHSGNYKVEVYIPTESTVTSNAIYKIYHADGMDEIPINQALNGSSWVNLGEFTFSNDNSCYVYLGDAVGAKSIGNDKQIEERLDKILYDAVRFTFIDSGSPYIFQSDFENNNGGLTTNLDWEWGEDTLCGANSGTKVWGTVLNGNYHDRADVYLDLTIETGENSKLSFYHWHKIEDVYRDVVFDGGNIKISTDGGNSFEILYPEGGYPHTMRYSMYNPLSYEPCFSGETEGWEPVECNLNTYPNQEVIIRWHFGSDGATIDRGWYLDDIIVEELPLQIDAPNVSIVTLENTSQLIWDEVENAVIYKIYFCSEPNGIFSLLHETNDTFFTIDENVSIGFYYVKASNEVGRKEIVK